MTQAYSSFSSLIWKRGSKPHQWLWNGYEVLGVGVSPQGTGGRWYAKGPRFNGNKVGYFNEFDARASAETHELEAHVPLQSVADVRVVCRHLSDVPLSFEKLLVRTGFRVSAKTRDAGRLSEALALGYDLEVLRVSIVTGSVGYLLDGSARSREACLHRAEDQEPVETVSILEMVK
jgi:hypothetical protein